uniref:NADH dehydrogenase subunit 3 n=1 Tax=Capillidium rhysosporum TaxID=181046 RepID=UPI0020C8C9EF|nr:NADH dehydrogenase subunit 3 [Capillidium rhysosporum]QWY25707.1 NADH dehydrogenase subunit 3 [Capillidium rhysosporum]
MNNLLLLIIMTTIIVFLLLFVNLILGDNKPYINKLSPYECGLIPLGDCRATLNIQYILVAILFIIFDIEVIVLLPYALTINNIYTYWIMIIFIVILTIGFYYEISKGALKYVKSAGD